MVYLMSDPHLGHRNIGKFRSFVEDSDDNTAQFLDQWKKTVRKEKDIVYILGDVAFNRESLRLLKGLRGRKILIKGNHDDLVPTSLQAEVFEQIYGMLKYKGFWLTHCPIHPDELRKQRGNCHGHVHSQNIKKGWGSWKKDDPRYFNVCVDNIFPKYDSWFVTLDQVREYFKIKL